MARCTAPAATAHTVQGSTPSTRNAMPTSRTAPLSALAAAPTAANALERRPWSGAPSLLPRGGPASAGLWVSNDTACGEAEERRMSWETGKELRQCSGQRNRPVMELRQSRSALKRKIGLPLVLPSISTQP